jgi:hypothetical protein
MRTRLAVILHVYTYRLSRLLVYTNDTALCLRMYNLLGLYNSRSKTISYLEVKLGLLQEERLRERMCVILPSLLAVTFRQ